MCRHAARAGISSTFAVACSSRCRSTPTVWHSTGHRRRSSRISPPTPGAPRGTSTSRGAVRSFTSSTGLMPWTIGWLDADGRTEPLLPKPELYYSPRHSAANGTRPAFSPDGRWVADVSNETGTSEVYVRPSPVTSVGAGGKWQVSASLACRWPIPGAAGSCHRGAWAPGLPCGERLSIRTSVLRQSEPAAPRRRR